MSFRKIRTIKVSERVFDIVCEDLDIDVSEYNIKIGGYLECFNNCREQGYVLHIYSTDYDNEERTRTDFHIWAHEHRNSDDIVVRWQTEYPQNGMFNEETYRERTICFKYDDYQKAANYIHELVTEHFKHEYSNYR